MSKTLDFLTEQNNRFLEDARKELKNMMPDEPACNIDAAGLVMTELFTRYRTEFYNFFEQQLKEASTLKSSGSNGYIS